MCVCVGGGGGGGGGRGGEGGGGTGFGCVEEGVANENIPKGLKSDFTQIQIEIFKNQLMQLIRTRLCGPCVVAKAGDYFRFGPIR